MSDKKHKFKLDYEQENYKKVVVEPTKKFDVNDVNDDILEEELSQLSDTELTFKLENESLSNEEINIIKKILKSRK